ncbi:MAG: SDR family NAD(P)-dependent oxidoreductase [Rhizobiales bacterium]|nr:SDR family NAD(P)-dependent oxidoreductase [Hyphomicrobiales bacterium]
MTQKAILITGCSTGIGLACARGLKQRGCRVLATARTPQDLAMLEREGLEAIALDYRFAESVDACIAEVRQRTDGRLYALFNNGAYGQPGAVEDVTRAVLEEQFAANFFGWHQLTRGCLPMLRANGGGRIVQCSSVLGLLALKYRGPYNASKFALEGLTDTMRLELRGSGIKVVTINPGPITSMFVQNARAAFEKNIDMTHSHYKDDFEKQRRRLDKGGASRFKLPPERVLEKLVIALEKPNPRAHYYVTVPTHVAALMRRLLPSGLLDSFADRNS